MCTTLVSVWLIWREVLGSFLRWSVFYNVCTNDTAGNFYIICMPKQSPVYTISNRTIWKADPLPHCICDYRFTMRGKLSTGFSSDIWHPAPSFSPQLWWQSCGKRSACPEAKPRGQSSCPKPGPGRGQGGFGALHPGKVYTSKHTDTPVGVCGWLAAA